MVERCRKRRFAGRQGSWLWQRLPAICGCQLPASPTLLGEQVGIQLPGCTWYGYMINSLPMGDKQEGFLMYLPWPKATATNALMLCCRWPRCYQPFLSDWFRTSIPYLHKIKSPPVSKPPCHWILIAAAGSFMVAIRSDTLGAEVQTLIKWQSHPVHDLPGKFYHLLVILTSPCLGIRWHPRDWSD